MSQLFRRSILSVPALFTLVLMACGSEGSGTLTVVVSGEEGAEQGFPATEFADGWAVSFERYLVSIGGVDLTMNGDAVASVVDQPKVLDLHRGLGEHSVLQNVPAGRVGMSFDVQAPGVDSEGGEGVSAADLEEMRTGGLTYVIEGTATKSPYAPVTFRFALAAPVRLEDCTNGVDGTQGVIVQASASNEAEITVHVEHLFFDRLGTHSGVQLRFEAIAAMADANHHVTMAELAGQSLLNPIGMDGAPLTDADGSPVIYDPGASSVQTLDQFLVRSVRDQVHLNGGGLCTIVAP